MTDEQLEKGKAVKQRLYKIGLDILNLEEDIKALTWEGYYPKETIKLVFRQRYKKSWVSKLEYREIPFEYSIKDIIAGKKKLIEVYKLEEVKLKKEFKNY